MNFSYGLLSYKKDYIVRRGNEKLSLMLRETFSFFTAQTFQKTSYLEIIMTVVLSNF